MFRDWGGVKVQLSQEQADGFSGTCDEGKTSCTPNHWQPIGGPNWWFGSCN